MSNPKSTYPVVIVGGGPVGLFLGICLQQAGISCRILEKRTEPTNDSRSLGIHPPCLELFASAGFADPLTREGIHIKHGHAFANAQKIGSLSFEAGTKPFNYILSLPQSRTERILEYHLNQLNDRVLIRGAEVTGISENKTGVRIAFQASNRARSIQARFVVGCDGKESFTRKQAGILFEGQSYPDTYVMGDFMDNTVFGSDAAIFLCNEGLIESFPLPENRRRWVVKTNTYHPSGQREIIEQVVQQRIQYTLSGIQHFMLSSFGVEKRVAVPMVKNRFVLAGDAAHVVSPIGGQGMNLGWLGAWDLAQCLAQIFSHRTSEKNILTGFEKRRKKAVQNAIRRSEMNMRLGRKVRFPGIRNGIVSAMLNTPLAPFMARLFTMRGIERWPV